MVQGACAFVCFHPPAAAAATATLADKRAQLLRCCREQVLAKKAFHHLKTIKKVLLLGG